MSNVSGPHTRCQTNTPAITFEEGSARCTALVERMIQDYATRRGAKVSELRYQAKRAITRAVATWQPDGQSFEAFAHRILVKRLGSAARSRAKREHAAMSELVAVAVNAMPASKREDLDVAVIRQEIDPRLVHELQTGLSAAYVARVARGGR